MNVKRVTRLIQILQMLGSGNGQNPDGLAQACGVSRRTIFRDIDTLKTAGVPVAFDHATDRYSIPSAHFLPPTNFTAEEALAIIGLATQMGDRRALPFCDAAQRAALKLEAGLPPELRGEVRSLIQSVRIRHPRTNALEGKRDVYQDLVDAQAERRQVWITYKRPNDPEAIETVLRPYQMMFGDRAWYIIGRSSLHKEVRTFHVGRILSHRLMDEYFKPPRGFSLERYLGNAWRMIPGPGPDQHVHVRFKPMVAENVAEVRWHATQRTEFAEDGSLDFYATVSGVIEISWWILGYGDQAEVVKPLELRRLVAQRAANMAKAYRRG